MFEIRPILLVNGLLLCILGACMLIPALLDFAEGNRDWLAFATAFCITMFAGGGLYFTNRGYTGEMTLRDMFLLTATLWFVIPAFAALPLSLSQLNLSYTDAFFEAVSGLTTTGSTVISGLDTAPPGVLLWRSLMEYLGGIGIIVLAVAVLPSLSIGGMQLFHRESSDISDKILPRASEIAHAIGAVYFFLNATCALFLWLGGMSGLDAICHAMTAVATGGFSTRDMSIAYYNSPLLEFILCVFMLLGSLPFLLYFRFAQGHPRELWKDTQVRFFLSYIGAIIVILVFWRVLMDGEELAKALREAFFNVISLVSTTGFVSSDYNQWSPFAVMVMFMIMFSGGCTGSTTGGIKIFRYQVLYEIAKTQIYSLVQPHGVFVPRYNGKPITSPVARSVLTFFIMYVLCFLCLTLALSAVGFDFTSSMSSAAQAISNVGPGLGELFGPVDNYSGAPMLSKWLLAIGMIVGRLELFTILVLFAPRFWRH